MNKNFSFEFIKTDSGWLDFEIHIQNATFHYFFSDDISTQPEELILWLEKIYNKDYCEFECETEDFFLWFDYDGKEFRLYDQINLLEKTGYDRHFTSFKFFSEFEIPKLSDFPISSSFDSLDSEGKKSMIF